MLVFLAPLALVGLGLLAVVPLVADTVRDKGCRW